MPKNTKNGDVDQGQLDMAALGLGSSKAFGSDGTSEPEEVPKASLAREKLAEEVKKTVENAAVDGKKAVSIVVIGESFRPCAVIQAC